MTEGKRKTRFEYRDEWPKGPWDVEPDAESWTDAETGYNCAILRGKLGVWCGYVMIDGHHPAFLKHYSDVNVNVHGDLTYSESFLNLGVFYTGINNEHHFDKEEKATWWLGFNCSHFGDVIPTAGVGSPSYFTGPGRTYKDVHFVRAEVTSLAKQLKEMENEQRKDD
jgi:hypothetical protein